MSWVKILRRPGEQTRSLLFLRKENNFEKDWWEKSAFRAYLPYSPFLRPGEGGLRWGEKMTDCLAFEK
jgi:hypothetical protein